MQSRHRRRALAATVVAAALAAGCSGPEVGPADAPPPPSTGYLLVLTGGDLDADARARVTFTLTLDGAPVAATELTRLRPSFTLAALATDPVSGLGAWQSTILNGAALARLPLGGPGTPPGLVLEQVRQPGAETTGTFSELGDGAFRYTYATALPAGLDPTVTFRAGAWLAGVPGAEGTSATVDFVTTGGAPRPRDTVLDARCNVCHVRLTAHGGFRAGVKLCLTCHTIQNADPDTVDPAALAQALTVNPTSRTVVAGTGPTTFSAALRHSSATVGWSLSTGAPGTLSGTGGATVTYTPPGSVAGPTELTLVASAAGFTAPVAVTVVPPAAPAPAVEVSPPAQSLVAAPGTPAVRFTALLSGVAGPVTWTLAPSSGAGTLAASTGAAVDWTPPGRVTAATTVTVTATAGGQSGVATVTLEPGWSGSASPATDPSPLDLGRLVHRIHRGKRLPTLYLSSSIAPAPPLPSATALPLPFLPGRNAMAPGAKAAYVGFRGTELLVGRIAARVENGQPAVTVAEGIGFPQDLRDCDACHLAAPQASEVVDAISRRTCQGCHPDVWFGAGPITDLVHFSHPGGPQADDSQCTTCHVTGPGRPVVRADIAEAHVHPILSPFFSAPSVEIVGVTGLRAGERPTVRFTVSDRVGRLTSLGAPTPAVEAGPTASPVPRALASLGLLVSGPAADFLTGNAPLREAVPLTLASDAEGVFSFTFSAALPATASGTWALGAEARRRQAVPLYDTANDLFRWPYTGEAITEYSDNPVVYVDTAFGTWPGGAPVPRRLPVERALCQNCHLDVTFHGGLRHSPEYCVLCHTPDATDWARRPKDPSGNVNLATVNSPTSFGTYDNLEERSIHFKVMIHRLHTGEGQGTARIEVGAPHVVAGLFLDEARFPAPLANCLLCHPGETWSLEAIPAGAPPTTANESATIRHGATASHAAGEPQLLPQTASCNSCHATAFAFAHAAKYTTAEGEQCLQCHVRGALGVRAAHGLPEAP